MPTRDLQLQGPLSGSILISQWQKKAFKLVEAQSLSLADVVGDFAR